MQRRRGFIGFVTLCCLVLLECLKVCGQVRAPHNVSDLHWHPATATWYGSPDGDGSDAVEGSSGSGEPSAVQERGRVRGVLQSEVLRQEHMLKEGGDRNCDRRVPRWLLLQWPHPLRPKWCSLWPNGDKR
ncbi:putative Beta-expansin 3 precursor [Corchorus olitorius]|uniref:Beta-expansin 3 n=1 Tax=Corchorus olitorius TaxID=93759 RepID=A0A1R3KJB8_9ROSI|nr:putative Beta-expansin 3 precursor [Corchorus olitorius]